MKSIKGISMPVSVKKPRRMYDTVRWRKEAKRFLSKNPRCVLCLRTDIYTRATIVDHITPHKGDPVLFWDQSNWQPVCASCHSGHKRLQELHGYSQVVDVNGFPVDKEHPWNKGKQND